MGWLSSSRGRGIWRGLWRRPSSYILFLVLLLGLVQMHEPAMLFGVGLATAYLVPWIWGPLIMLFAFAVLIESLIGWLPRSWLIVPLVLLGGYFGIALALRIDVASRAQHWLAQNSARAFTYADGTWPVVLERHTAGAATDLLALYDFPGPYYTRSRGRFDAYDRRETTCQPPAQELPIRTEPATLLPDAPTPPAGARICMTLNASPPASVRTVTVDSVGRYDLWGGGVDVWRTVLSIHGRKERMITLLSAHGIGWWPVIGLEECGFQHLYYCRIRVWQEASIPIATFPEDNDEAVVLLLGLQPITSTEIHEAVAPQ